MRVAVTGANGFLGARLCARLTDAGHEVVAIVRRVPAAMGHVEASVGRTVAVGDLGPDTDFMPALDGADAVVHLAARAHRGEARDAGTREEFRRVNVMASETLVTQAARAGVPRFVFMSSSKVHGERSPRDPAGRPRALSPADPPAPAGPYGESKWAAEQQLAAACARAGMALTVLRPPLVYGPGQRGNLRALMDAIARGWRLPLAAIDNRRSLVHREHLLDAVLLALEMTGAAQRIYTIADCALSTPALVVALAQGMGRPARLVRCPVGLLRAAGRAAGRGAAIERLTGSLLLDSAAIERELAWRPRIALEAAMAEIGEAYWSARDERR